jgi:hypothetical protein
MFTAPQRITVGRNPDSLVHLDDPSVSLRHAEISLDASGVRITDLGSRTGTWVNQQQTTPDQALAPTDEINIGAFRLRQTIHRSAGAGAGAAAGARARALAPPTPAEVAKPAPAPAPAPEPKPRAQPAIGALLDEALRGTPARPQVTAPPVVASPSPLADMRASQDSLTQILPGRRPEVVAAVTAPTSRAEPAPVPGRQPTRPTIDEIDLLLSSAFEPGSASPREPEERTVNLKGDADLGRLGQEELTIRREISSLDIEGPAPEPPGAAPVSQEARPAPSPNRMGGGTVKIEKVPLPKPEPARAEAKAEKAEAKVGRAEKIPHADKAPAREKAAEPQKKMFPSDAPPKPVVLRESIDEEDDEDEDDDSDFVAPFDLIAVLGKGAVTKEASSVPATVEVAGCRADRVMWMRHVRKGQPLKVDSPASLGEYQADGSFVLFPKACGAYTIRQDGKKLPAREAEALAKDGTIKLVPGMQVQVPITGDEFVLVYLVPQAGALAKIRPQLRPILDRAVQGAASVAVHVLTVVIIALTLFSNKTSASEDVNAGRLVEIKIKDIEVEPPPPPPPPPEPVPDTAPTPVQPQPQPNQPVVHQVSSKTPPTQQQTQADQPSAAASKILKALGGAPAAGPDIGALSNLDAIPHGASGGFKVSDAVGKASGDTLRLGGGGGGDIVTKTASQVATEHVGVKTEGVVRARVTAPPAAASVEGSLDRGEIQKVVNAHMYQVQGCYERQLVKTPGLGGKVSPRWVISPTGSVSSVKIAQSSIQSMEVVSCIQSAIQGWTFPAPRGGSVTVTYPFGFSTFGN